MESKMNKEELLEKWSAPITVLDKGFVRLIDTMGDDSSICQMARVSYGEGTKSINDDTALIRYLMRHFHTSPFEGCIIKIHAKMPILTARQWVRHRTASLNEMSARYSVLPDQFYVPDLERIQRQSTTNRQGSGEQLPESEATITINQIDEFCNRAYKLYQELIDRDVSREIARSVLPVNIYTEWYWVQDLHNLFHFLKLRLNPAAQLEIRQYAQVIADITRDWVPTAWKAFEDYRLNSVTFSAQEVQWIREALSQTLEILNANPDIRKESLEAIGITNKRERMEFIQKLRINM